MDQAFIIAVKPVVDFVTFLGGRTVKDISNLYVFTYLTSTIPATPTAYISHEWIQLRCNYVIFYSPDASI